MERHRKSGGPHPRLAASGRRSMRLAALLGCLIGCASGGQTPPARGAAQPGERLPNKAPVGPAGRLEPSSEGTPMAPACAGTEDADDLCDAIDSDCDGRIDEGCGYAGGALQITLAWDADADLDLYVSEPSGDQLFFNREHRRSSGGGHMDQDARGQCRPEQPHTRVENVYWADTPSPGEYAAEIHYFSPCGERGPVTATLTVALAGQVLGTFAYKVEPEQRVGAVRLQVGEVSPPEPASP